MEEPDPTTVVKLLSEYQVNEPLTAVAETFPTNAPKQYVKSVPVTGAAGIALIVTVTSLEVPSQLPSVSVT